MNSPDDGTSEYKYLNRFRNYGFKGKMYQKHPKKYAVSPAPVGRIKPLPGAGTPVGGITINPIKDPLATTGPIWDEKKLPIKRGLPKPPVGGITINPIKDPLATTYPIVGYKKLTFQNTDTDGNGVISQQEADAMLSGATGASAAQIQNDPFAQKVLNNFAAVDRDGDGIEQKEASAAMGEIHNAHGPAFEKKGMANDLNFYADADGNGRISAQEASIALQNATPEQRNGQFAQKVLGNVASVDKNGDGVDMREAMAAMYGDNAVTTNIKPWQAGGFQKVEKGSTPVDPATGSEGTDSTVTNPLETGGIPAVNNDGTGDVGPQIGAAPGSTEQEDAINRQNQFYDKLADRQKEKKEYSANKPTGKIEDVNIGKAAEKSAAMLAFDLNQNGKLSQAERSLMASGDRNNNGIVGKKGLEKFVKEADTNNSGLVSMSEVQNHQIADVNNNNKTSKIENKAFKQVFGDDGDATKKEARAYLKLQAEKGGADKKVDKTAEQIATSILNKPANIKAGGGSLADMPGGGAMAGGGQVAKPKNGNDDGPGKKKKK